MELGFGLVNHEIPFSRAFGFVSHLLSVVCDVNRVEPLKALKRSKRLGCWLFGCDLVDAGRCLAIMARGREQ